MIGEILMHSMTIGIKVSGLFQAFFGISYPAFSVSVNESGNQNWLLEIHTKTIKSYSRLYQESK